MYKLFATSFLLLFTSASAADVSIAASYNSQSVPVYFDDERKYLDLSTKGLQLAYQLENWSAGLALTTNSQSQSWHLINANRGGITIDQHGQELFVKHYDDDWSLGASIGLNASAYSQDELQSLPNNQNNLAELTNSTVYNNQDLFVELKLNHWIDLARFIEDVSLTIETFAVYHKSDSTIESYRTIKE